MEANGTLDIPQIATALRAKHGAKAPGYQRIWRAATEGRFPTRKVGNRWRVREEDMPLVEAAFGLAGDVPPAAIAA